MICMIIWYPPVPVEDSVQPVRTVSRSQAWQKNMKLSIFRWKHQTAELLLIWLRHFSTHPFFFLFLLQRLKNSASPFWKTDGRFCVCSDAFNDLEINDIIATEEEEGCYVLKVWCEYKFKFHMTSLNCCFLFSWTLNDFLIIQNMKL